MRRTLIVTLALVAAATAVPTASAARSDAVRVNELQAIGTHNSYKRELTRTEQATYDSIIATPATTTSSSRTATSRSRASSGARACAASSSTCSPIRRAASTASRSSASGSGSARSPTPEWTRPGHEGPAHRRPRLRDDVRAACDVLRADRALLARQPRPRAAAGAARAQTERPPRGRAGRGRRAGLGLGADSTGSTPRSAPCSASATSSPPTTSGARA